MSKLILDVSNHQGKIDFAKMKTAGATAVIIRCGYRGYSSGKIGMDERYSDNIKKAEAAGLPVGIYWFTSAISTKESQQEAESCCRLASGHKLAFPIFLDLEYSTSERKGRADRLSAKARTEYAIAFLERCKSLGYDAGVYCNPDFWQHDLVPVQLEHYPRWVAHYGNSPGVECDIWQYSSSGDGHKYGCAEKRVDLNWMSTDFTRGDKSRFEKPTAAPSATGNPYPAPVATVCSNATADALNLHKWIPQGDCVQAVQWELTRLGYQPGTIDGICGPKTTSAVKEFQSGHGLVVDGAAGPKTWAALVAAKTQEKKEPVNWMKRVAEAAKKVYPLCVGKVHSGANVEKVVDLASLKKYKALSCNRMVSITLQEAGILDKGVIVAHTPKASGKKTIKDAVKNADKLKHVTLHWFNKPYKSLPERWKKAGCIYFYNSNAAISAGNGKVWSCNRSKGYTYKGRGDYLRTDGYPLESGILVVGVPDEE